MSQFITFRRFTPSPSHPFGYETKTVNRDQIVSVDIVSIQIPLGAASVADLPTRGLREATVDSVIYETVGLSMTNIVAQQFGVQDLQRGVKGAAMLAISERFLVHPHDAAAMMSALGAVDLRDSPIVWPVPKKLELS